MTTNTYHKFWNNLSKKKKQLLMLLYSMSLLLYSIWYRKKKIKDTQKFVYGMHQNVTKLINELIFSINEVTKANLVYRRGTTNILLLLPFPCSMSTIKSSLKKNLTGTNDVWQSSEFFNLKDTKHNWTITSLYYCILQFLESAAPNSTQIHGNFYTSSITIHDIIYIIADLI